jgi:AcrR family transcriptional regulator
VSGHTATKIAPRWAGRPPADDAEASQRIRDAARRCIDRNGVNVRIAEVARELGVSRPTVYRHYSSGQAVLRAVALESIDPLLAGVASMEVDLSATPAEVVAEVGCLLFEWLCRDSQLRQLTRFGAGTAADDVTSSAALLLTRGLIERAVASFDEPADADHLDEIAELVTRLVHSTIERPALLARRTGEPSEPLRRWVTTAVGGILTASTQSTRDRDRQQLKPATRGDDRGSLRQ